MPMVANFYMNDYLTSICMVIETVVPAPAVITTPSHGADGDAIIELNELITLTAVLGVAIPLIGNFKLPDIVYAGVPPDMPVVENCSTFIILSICTDSPLPML